MTGRALVLVGAFGKRYVCRRQLWKVAMLTGEEVSYTVHNFLNFTSNR